MKYLLIPLLITPLFLFAQKPKIDRPKTVEKIGADIIYPGQEFEMKIFILSPIKDYKYEIKYRPKGVNRVEIDTAQFNESESSYTIKTMTYPKRPNKGTNYFLKDINYSLSVRNNGVDTTFEYTVPTKVYLPIVNIGMQDTLVIQQNKVTQLFIDYPVNDEYFDSRNTQVKIDGVQILDKGKNYVKILADGQSDYYELLLITGGNIAKKIVIQVLRSDKKRR